MKIKYQGIYRGEYQLPCAPLPRNAIKMKEPESLNERYKNSLLFLYLMNFIVVIILVISTLLGNEFSLELNNMASICGFIGGLFFIFIHEPLHAIAYGSDAEVQIYFYVRQLSFFTISTKPILKIRYIIASLLPHIVFGWIPLLLWVFILFQTAFASFIFYFSVLATYSGMMDYLNVFNALWQMPTDSVRQSSVLNSYWYVP